MITTLSLSQKDQNKTLVLSESVGMEEGAGRAMMNVNAGDSFMKKFQDFIQKHVAYGISSSLSGVQGIIHVEELLI
jgi:hypothetical protein